MGHVNQENASATQHNQSAHLKVAARELIRREKEAAEAVAQETQELEKEDRYG